MIRPEPFEHFEFVQLVEVYDHPLTREDDELWAGEERQYAEWEALMAACTVHLELDYHDPEGDGCPSCGYGAK